eukprot:TRINITY_DN64405_c0_g1_i1.p1 TRINITY_DN64405_c0_g1~~TRINITY_DN64405_c0_g1_i1.p1  ORF type:complete len:142 (-),score=22.81 TRINITY_DN64405_c0_g1_i1:66-491(-)
MNVQNVSLTSETVPEERDRTAAIAVAVFLLILGCICLSYFCACCYFLHRGVPEAYHGDFLAVIEKLESNGYLEGVLNKMDDRQGPPPTAFPGTAGTKEDVATDEDLPHLEMLEKMVMEYEPAKKSEQKSPKLGRGTPEKQV